MENKKHIFTRNQVLGEIFGICLKNNNNLNQVDQNTKQLGKLETTLFVT